MRDKYMQMVRDSTPGRFEGEGPMTAYVWECMMNGDFGDDESSLPDWGESVARYGKRILHISSQGFISLWSYDSVADAELEMQGFHEQWDSSEEEYDINQSERAPR